MSRPVKLGLDYYGVEALFWRLDIFAVGLLEQERVLLFPYWESCAQRTA